MIDPRRYTSGRIAVANLSASVESLEIGRVEGATFENLLALSQLLFLRGDLLGRIVDHDRAELVATEALALSHASASSNDGAPRPPSGSVSDRSSRSSRI